MTVKRRRRTKYAADSSARSRWLKRGLLAAYAIWDLVKDD